MYTLTLILLALLLLIAAVSDLYRFRIPNSVVLAVFLLYPVHVLAAPEAVPWIGSSLLMLGGLVFTLLAFNAGLMGAGDGKLVSALLLWSGTEMALDMLIITGFAGLGLAILFGTRLRFTVALALNSSARYARNPLSHSRIPVADGSGDQAAPADPAHPIIQGLSDSLLANKLPYGMAIATGGLFLIGVRLGLLQPLS